MTDRPSHLFSLVRVPLVDKAVPGANGHRPLIGGGATIR
jgi:hypothetical protein